MKQLEYKWAIDSPTKQLHYRWGYTVGVLFLLCAALLFVAGAMPSPFDCTVVERQFICPDRSVTDWIFVSLVFSLLPFLTGIGILWHKAIGWYFYCLIVALLMVLVLWWAGVAALALMVLLSSFLFVQVRYWRRRAPLYQRKKIAV